MLLHAARSILLIVDVQERLAPAMHDRDGTVRNCGILIKAAKELGVPIVMSEQYPKGLGPTVPELRELLSEGSILPKMSFSCAGEPALKDRLTDEDRPQIVVAGMEAHVCVLQSALDLQGPASEAGGGAFVVADATDSRRPESKAVALDRFRHAGVTVVTTEMVVFEWMKTAENPVFKAVHRLVR